MRFKKQISVLISMEYHQCSWYTSCFGSPSLDGIGFAQCKLHSSVRALNTFLDGLAGLGVNKNLINKKLLSDLLEKEQTYDDGNESDNKTDDEDSSDSG